MEKNETEKGLWGVEYLDTVVRKGPSEEMTFEPRSKGFERPYCSKLWDPHMPELWNQRHVWHSLGAPRRLVW